MGVATFWRLLGDHGTAEAALAALPAIAAAAGVADYSVHPVSAARDEMRAGLRAGARLVARGEQGYPALLSEIAEAPPLLWVRGNAALALRHAIALVGARNASSLGLRTARALAEGLAEKGFAIVSGLARGIDAAAHQAALESGTIAVVAGGADVVYPPENAALASMIADRGLILTEQPPGLQPQARHFPLRNRIIAGMARAVVVVEAAAQSGSLITARIALDMGREVMAVPGHPFDGRAGGCNLLIRDGATLVRGPRDVIDAIEGMQIDDSLAAQPDREGRPAGVSGVPLGAVPGTAPAPAAPPRMRPADAAALHGRILDRLGPSPLAEDQLIRDLDVPAAVVAPELLTLELDGRILRQPGGLLSRLA